MNNQLYYFPFILDIIYDINYNIVRNINRKRCYMTERVYNKSYFNRLLKSKTTKKQIAVYLDDETVQKIDMINKVFSSLSDSKSFSRNALIEEAIEKYIEESENFLHENQNLDISAMIEEEKARTANYDTVILSTNYQGFKDTFLGEREANCWYPCRISESRMVNLKYIALYCGYPISGISHYAEIDRFEYDEQRQCRVCYFKGSPKELPHKIDLGTKDSCFFIGAKYTTLSDLMNETKADKLEFE